MYLESLFTSKIRSFEVVFSAGLLSISFLMPNLETVFLASLFVFPFLVSSDIIAFFSFPFLVIMPNNIISILLILSFLFRWIKFEDVFGGGLNDEG